MLPLWLIVVAGSLALREAMGVEPAWLLAPASAASATLGGLLSMALGLCVVLRQCARRAEQHGSVRAVKLAERLQSLARLAASVWVGACVLVFGWLDAVRAVTGDLVALDEAIAAAPLVVFVAAASWWHAPIDAMIRQAALQRDLFDGRAVYPPLSRSGYVVDRLRHEVAFVGAILLCVLAWREGADRAFDAFASDSAGDPSMELARAGAHLAGVVVIVAVAPLLLRLTWKTTPIVEGDLHDRLETMCVRLRAPVRRVLVWRTHGRIVNAAVIGVFAKARYIVLSDALLDRMPIAGVEAVMAHEIAHIKRRHIPWLAAVAISALTLSLWVGAWALVGVESIGVLELAPAVGEYAESGLLVVSFACALLAFGFASRRFEWQADAFAARALSDAASPAGRAERIHPGAAEVMSLALRQVANDHGTAMDRFEWRHGSIAQRRRRLDELGGVVASKLPIDQVVRRWKIAAALGVVATGWIMYAEAMRAYEQAERQRRVREAAEMIGPVGDFFGSIWRGEWRVEPSAGPGADRDDGGGERP